MSQGLTVLENSVAPDAPDTNYRTLFPMDDGWYEKDAAGVTFKLTNAVTGSGTIATNGYTLTVPATGTAALLEAANIFTRINTFTSAGGAAVSVINTNDSNSAVTVLALRRRRATAGDPGVSFGNALSFYLEGMDGSDVQAGYLNMLWSSAQTDDTTSRNSSLQFVTMKSNTPYGAATLTATGTTFRGNVQIVNSLAIGTDATFYLQDRDTVSTWALYGASSALRFYYGAADQATLTTGGTMTLAGGLNVGTTGAGTGEVFAGGYKATAASPYYRWLESDQVLPAGLWQMRVQADVWQLNRNTAVAGDFSTSTTPFKIDASDIATFSGGINVGTASTAATGQIYANKGAAGSSNSLGLWNSSITDGQEIYASFGKANGSSTSFLISYVHHGTTAASRYMYLAAYELGATPNIKIDAAGASFFNDTSNANSTSGLTINQFTASNEILALKSTSVAHGITGFTETDTFGFFKRIGAGGGCQISGVNYESGGPVVQNAGLRLQAVGNYGLTSKNANGFGYLEINVMGVSGTNTAAVGANVNLVSIANNNSVQFIFDAEGDSFENGTGWTAYDDYDDLALLHALDHSLDKKLSRAAGQWMRDNRRALERARVVMFNEDTDGVPFINKSRLGMLLVGAVRQLGDRIERLESIAGL